MGVCLSVLNTSARKAARLCLPATGSLNAEFTTSFLGRCILTKQTRSALETSQIREIRLNYEACLIVT